MIPIASLVLYKGKPAILADIESDRITIRFADGDTKKVREKDVSPLHPGPLDRFPAPTEGGDFDTAYGMLAQGETNAKVAWAELSELVFGSASPADILACLRRADSDPRFRLDGERLEIVGTEEYAKALGKASKKAMEESIRSKFAAALGEAAHRRDRRALDELLKADPDSGRFFSELEAFTVGSSESCPIAAAAGIRETREAVHEALLASGRVDFTFNPWPRRAGSQLSPPKDAFPTDEFPDLKLERRDLTSLQAWAIDNEDSTDPDDAISIDGMRIWVHVADPSAFVVPGSPTDTGAIERGSTLYLPEKTVPMLPNSAVQRLGLGLSEISPALSFGIDSGADGAIESIEIVPSIVRVTRLSYSLADESLLGTNADFGALESIASARRERRMRNGAVEIEFPEVSIRARDGEIAFIPRRNTRSAGIVKEMMLLAGEAAARWAFEKSLPFVYSSQQGNGEARGGDLPAAERGGRPESPLSSQSPSESYSLRRGMRASVLGPECQAHRGLGLSFYSQVTSPLRRYQDLLAHRQIRAFLRSEAAEKAGGKPCLLTEDEISKVCASIGLAASANRQAERDSVLHWVSAWLSRRESWEGKAIVLAHSYAGIVAFLPDFGIESEIRCRSKPELDSSVGVRLTRASIPSHDFTFDLVSS